MKDEENFDIFWKSWGVSLNILGKCNLWYKSHKNGIMPFSGVFFPENVPLLPCSWINWSKIESDGHISDPKDKKNPNHRALRQLTVQDPSDRKWSTKKIFHFKITQIWSLICWLNRIYPIITSSRLRLVIRLKRRSLYLFKTDISYFIGLNRNHWYQTSDIIQMFMLNDKRATKRCAHYLSKQTSEINFCLTYHSLLSIVDKRNFIGRNWC